MVINNGISLNLSITTEQERSKIYMFLKKDIIQSILNF